MKKIKNALLVSLILAVNGCYLLYPSKDGFRYDPIEDDPEFQKILIIVNKKIAERELCKGLEKEMGANHCFWPAQKEILRKEHNIHWRSPAELNPSVIFE